MFVTFLIQSPWNADPPELEPILLTLIVPVLSLYSLELDPMENTCLMSEFLFIGLLLSTGHGAVHIENTSSMTFLLLRARISGFA
jgi:hypothetical protein